MFFRYVDNNKITDFKQNNKNIQNLYLSKIK